MILRRLSAALQWVGVIIMLVAPVVAAVTKAHVWVAAFVVGVVMMVAFGARGEAPIGPPNDWYKY